MATKTFTKKAIAKSLENQRDTGFNKGAKMALSIAVNTYNVPEYIREGILEAMKIK